MIKNPETKKLTKRKLRKDITDDEIKENFMCYYDSVEKKQKYRKKFEKTLEEACNLQLPFNNLKITEGTQLAKKSTWTLFSKA